MAPELFLNINQLFIIYNWHDLPFNRPAYYPGSCLTGV
jgi:hypothetical protein